jgi:hypothetical protein
MLRLSGWALPVLAKIVTGLVVYLIATRLLSFTTFTAVTREVISAAAGTVFVGYFLSDAPPRS